MIQLAMSVAAFLFLGWCVVLVLTYTVRFAFWFIGAFLKDSDEA